MRLGEILRQWKEIDTSLDFSRKQCQILSDLNSWKNQKTPQSETLHENKSKSILRELCPVDDWSRYGFIEMNNANTENF